ncbi:MAG: hypothetical protein ABIO70_27185 [Pseudomonadota bacterium]
MTPTRLAVSTLVLALLSGLPSASALAQDRQLRPDTSLGVSLERYCAAQLGRTDLTEDDLAACRAQLQAEVDDFATLDERADPLAAHADPAESLDFSDPDDSFEFTDLDADTQRGRAGRSAKKDASSSSSPDFDEDPVDDDDEFGFDFQFEGQETPEDPIEDFDFDPIDDPDAEPLGDLEAPPKPAPEAKAPPTGSAGAIPAAVQLDVVGKIPLADNYAPQIVATDRDSVVVELPVLLGRSRADFDGTTYCLVAEVYADGHRVGEARQEVTAASLAEFGPSFAFVKLLAPVTAKTGELEVRLGKAASMTAKATPLFSRKVAYHLL